MIEEGDIGYINPDFVKTFPKKHTAKYSLHTLYKVITVAKGFGIGLESVEKHTDKGPDGLPYAPFGLIVGCMTDVWIGHTEDDLLIPQAAQSSKSSTGNYPHICICGSPAFLMFNLFDCTNPECNNYRKR